MVHLHDSTGKILCDVPYMCTFLSSSLRNSVLLEVSVRTRKREDEKAVVVVVLFESSKTCSRNHFQLTSISMRLLNGRAPSVVSDPILCSCEVGCIRALPYRR